MKHSTCKQQFQQVTNFVKYVKVYASDISCQYNCGSTLKQLCIRTQPTIARIIEICLPACPYTAIDNHSEII